MSRPEDAFSSPFTGLGRRLGKLPAKPAAPPESPALPSQPEGADEDEAALFLTAVRGFQAAAAPETPPGEEAALFAEAMRDVHPVHSGGRALPQLPQAPAGGARRDPAAETEEDFLRGNFEFSLEYTEEFLEGHILGLDPALQAKLRAGLYSRQGALDLHGLNAEQAYAGLLAFIRHAYQQGKRSLLVVTGRGKNSPGGQGVLRENMREWLTRAPLKRVVLAFCTARPGDGGPGALYVLLRKYKKNGGKIIWDQSPALEEPLS